MRQTRLSAAVLVAALAGAALAEAPAGTITATLNGAAQRWVVVAGGFTESGNVVHVTVTGHPDPADPTTRGAVRLDLAVTLLEGEAADVFGTGHALVTAQDVHYLPGAEALPYSTAFGGSVSVTLETFRREDDRLALAGLFTARLLRQGSSSDAIALEGRFEARVKRLGG